jgi:uncharacterized membrane protein YgaE (UPF0421/DUF939 family)
MKEVDISDNFLTWVILKNISITNIKKETTISALAKEIKVSRYHPYFCNAMKMLEDKGILIVSNMYGRTKVITINIKELDNLIESSYIYQQYLDYLHHKKIFYMT